MRRKATLVVALSGSPESTVVLRTALGTAQLLDLGVEAIHVGEEKTPAARDVGALAQANGVRVHHRQGDVVAHLLDALASPRVYGAVMGVRRYIAGPRPAGAKALAVLRAASKPVVFVPPDISGSEGFVPRRLLVPVDGSEAVSCAVSDVEHHFRADADVDMVVLYVLDGHTPTMVDHPEHGLADWGAEFVLRHCPGEHRSFEWRTGDPGNAVIEVAEASASDLIVLCFGGDIDVGHGAVVREVLARASVPVFVVPIGQPAAVWEADSTTHPVSLGRT